VKLVVMVLVRDAVEGGGMDWIENNSRRNVQEIKQVKSKGKKRR